MRQSSASATLEQEIAESARRGAVLDSIGGYRTSPSHNLATTHFAASNVVAPAQEPFSTPGAGIAPLVLLVSFAYTEPLRVCMRNRPS